MNSQISSFRILALAVVGTGVLSMVLANPMQIAANMNLITPITPINPSPTPTTTIPVTPITPATPTPTVTQPITPITPISPTPTITQPITPIIPGTHKNHAPEFTTKNLDEGRVGKTYSESIKIEDKDADKVNVKIEGLPRGIFVLQCITKNKSRKTEVECKLRGKPTTARKYTVKVTAVDEHGAKTVKKYTLKIEKARK